MAEIRTDPADVDAEWLTEVLGDAGLDVTVEDASWQRVGTGQVGRCARFDVTYSAAPDDAPSSFVGKFASDDPVSCQTGVDRDCYSKEVGFYRELQSRVGIRSPHCYFADIVGRGPDFCILLEDMTPARQGDQMDGFGLDVARAALVELAGLHGPCWGDESLSEFEWLDTGSEDKTAEAAAIYAHVLPGFVERYGASLTPDVVDVCRQYGDVLAAGGIGSSERALVHVDFRADNLLVDERSVPPGVCTVDWQTISLGNPLLDVAYFLGASLTTPRRRRWEEELFDAYHGALVEAGVGHRSRDDCWRDYRRYALHGIGMSVISSMIVGQTERGDEMFRTMARRHGAHVLDLDSFAALD